jgi:hypothetical protein
VTTVCVPCGDPSDRGRAWARLDPVRPARGVRVGVDWHDALARLWPGPSRAVAQDTVIRLARAHGKGGLQYRATTGGVTGSPEPRWPREPSATVQDGSVVWTAEPRTSASLARTIATQAWEPQSGVTFSAASNTDEVFSVLVEGAEDGKDYQLVHAVELSDGQEDAAAVILPVRASVQAT